MSRNNQIDIWKKFFPWQSNRKYSCRDAEIKCQKNSLIFFVQNSRGTILRIIFEKKKLREKLRWRTRIELEHIVQKASQQIAKTIQNSKHFKKNSTKYSCWHENIGLQKTCHLCFARRAERKHCKIFSKKLFWHENLHWKLRKQFWKNQLKKNFFKLRKNYLFRWIFFGKTSRKQISLALLAISIESTAKKPFLLKVQKLITLDSFETKKTGLKKLSNILLRTCEADSRTPIILSLLNVQKSFYRDHFEKKRLSGKKQSPLRTLSSTFFIKVRKTSYNWTFSGNKMSKPLFWKRISLF